MKNIKIHQMFYDDKTKSQIYPGFIPLDNTTGNPTWYEFGCILNFLNENELEEDTLYGFFGNKVFEKTGFTGDEILNHVKSNSDSEVILLHFAWDQICFYQNPYEQGERWHPGLTHITQEFLNQAGVNVNITDLVTTDETSVFCNFVVATKDYWKEWKDLATKFYEYASDESNGIDKIQTPHRGVAPMKTFIQERFPALILSRNFFETKSIYNRSLVKNHFRFKSCNDSKKNMLENPESGIASREYILSREMVALST